MPIFTILEVVIGLTFMYMLLSLVVTWINEWVAQILNMRGKRLKQAIQNLFFKDPHAYMKNPEEFLAEHPEYTPFVEKFYAHPVIKALGKEKVDRDVGLTTISRLPSYIPPSRVSKVVLDILFDENYFDKTNKELKDLIESVPHNETQVVLKTFFNAGATSVDELRDQIESWFNDAMDRLHGWYKRRVHLLSFVVGLLLAVGFNVDTFVVADTLWREPTLRTSIVRYVEENQAGLEPTEDERMDIPVEGIREAITTLQWPIGWSETYSPKTSQMMQSAGDVGLNEKLGVVKGWSFKAVGWLLTALAASQGAPFWFDVLNQFTNLRASGDVPQKEGEGG